MRILYLTNQFYLHGGIEKMLSQKINYLIEKFGYEVILCTSENRGKDYIYPLHKNLKHIDLNIKYNRSKSYFSSGNLIKSYHHYRELKQFINKEKPDIIISVNKTPEQYFLPFIEKHIPKVKEFHSSGVSFKSSNSILGKINKRLFNLFTHYDCIVVLNKDEIKFYPFNNVTVIPNFIKINSSAIDVKKEKTILAAGRIAPVKQFDHLIRAWSKIAIQFPEWQVKIFGDGDEDLTAKLKSLIAELKLPNIRLMGQTENLKEEMEKASVYAMTSETECFPMVLLEAQAAGMAIISYDCPYGPRNIIEDNVTGILTPHNVIDDFSELLKNLLQNDKKRNDLGNRSKISVVYYREDSIMLEWKTLFNDLSN